MEGSETDARVVFTVQRGPRGQGVDLDFEGNDSLPPESLAAVLPPRKDAAFFALIEPGGASRLDTALRTAGARAGFLSLTVGAPRETFDPATGRLTGHHSPSTRASARLSSASSFPRRRRASRGPRLPDWS